MRCRSAVATATLATVVSAFAACGDELDRGASGAAAAAAAPASAAAAALAPPVMAGSLEITSVAVPEPVTGERTALYLVVRNPGDEADALRGLTSPAAGRAGLHRSEQEGGLSRMRAVDSIAVPAGGEARLAPGGFHGMLEALAAPLVAGDTLAVTLHFRGAGDVEVRALVVPYEDLDALYPPVTGAEGASGHADHGGEGR